MPAKTSPAKRTLNKEQRRLASAIYLENKRTGEMYGKKLTKEEIMQRTKQPIDRFGMSVVPGKPGDDRKSIWWKRINAQLDEPKGRKIGEETPVFAKAKKTAFGKETRILQAGLPETLLAPEAKRIAGANAKKIEESPYLVQRFEWIENALSGIGKPEGFLKKGCMVFYGLHLHKLDQRFQTDNSPAQRALAWGSVAGNQTMMDMAEGIKNIGSHYNCRVFFEQAAFRQDVVNGGNWGVINPVAGDPVLGIQLFDPNPKTLLQFAKAMAKRRPGKPIAIYSEGQKELDRHFLNTCRKHSNSAFLGKYLPVSSKN
ncbi:MAG: hypothetical protein HY917_03950 [Candidatus Diapherotrites archaeon]|nr:hypothetical protein [Candidatus Diapherotrites archaeon]